MTNLERIREELLGDAEKASAFIEETSGYCAPSSRIGVIEAAFCRWGKEHGMCVEDSGDDPCRACLTAWLAAEVAEDEQM